MKERLPEVNYESTTGVVHAGQLEVQWSGLTKCGVDFTIDPKILPRWIVTNQPVTCKNCKPSEKAVFALDKNIAIFGIDTDEKAKLATIRARILSLMETWQKHAFGKTSKKDFYSDIQWDLGDIGDDLEDYMRLNGNLHWCDEMSAFVPKEKVKK